MHSARLASATRRPGRAFATTVCAICGVAAFVAVLVTLIVTAGGSHARMAALRRELLPSVRQWWRRGANAAETQLDTLAGWQHSLLRRLRRALVLNNEANDRGEVDAASDGDSAVDAGSSSSGSSSSSSSSSGSDGSSSSAASADARGSGSGSGGGARRPLRKRRFLPTFLTNPAAGVKRLANATTAAYLFAVTNSEPVIFEAGAVRCTKHDWTLDFIRAQAGDDVVAVEASSNNRENANAGLHKERMTLGQYLDVFQAPGRSHDLYLAEESVDRTPRLKADIVEPFFSEDFDLDREQLWVGPGGQVSPLHVDEWDNVLCQLAGERTVTLFDPLQIDRLYPRSGAGRHFSQVDLSRPDHMRFPRLREAASVTVTLRAGEVLVLPACWWHFVVGGEGVNVAVNFWYLPSRMTELLYDVLLPPGDDE